MKIVTTTQFLTRIFLSYAVGIWCGQHLPLPIWTSCGVLTLYLVLVHIKQLHAHRCAHMFPGIMLCLIFCIGNGSIQVKLQNPVPESMYGTEVRFYGKLAYQPDRPVAWYSAHAVGRAVTKDGHTTPRTKFILHTKYTLDAQPIPYGEAVIAKGVLRKPSSQRNPGGFNNRDYLRMRGIFGTVHRMEEIERICTGNGKISLIWAEPTYPGRI